MTEKDSNIPSRESHVSEYRDPAEDVSSTPTVEQPAESTGASDVTAKMANRLSTDEAEEAHIRDAMQRRFERIAERTEESRRKTTCEQSEVFARVETALASLAQQTEAVAETPSTFSETVATSADTEAVETERAVRALSEQSLSRVEEAVPAGTWNSESAEVLTRHYEMEACHVQSPDSPAAPRAVEPAGSGAPTTAMPPVADQPSELPDASPTHALCSRPNVMPEAENASMPALEPEAVSSDHSSATEILDVDSERAVPSQSWFSERFEDLAARLDAAPSGEIPDTSLTLLLDRLTNLEARLDAALPSSGATSEASAGGGLHNIELCVAEIAAQLETTNAEVARIAEIEQQITAFTQQIGAEAGGDAGLFDPAAIADLVAERMASRPMALASGDTSYGELQAAGVGELTVMMKEFVNERRIEGEHANAVLDSMQQTIMRLLERMDAIESAPPNVAAAHATGVVPAAATASDLKAQDYQVATEELLAEDELLDYGAPPAAFGRRSGPAGNSDPEHDGDVSEDEDQSLRRLKQAVGQLESQPDRASPDPVHPQLRDRRPGAPLPVEAPDDATPKRPRRRPARPLDPVATRGRFVEAARAAAPTAQRAGRARKAVAGSSSRTRLLVAALALLVVGLGATTFVPGIKVKLPGLGQPAVTKQTSRAPKANNVTADTAAPKALTVPGAAAAPSAPTAPGMRYAPDSQSVPARELVQPAAIIPNETAAISPGAGDPVSGVSRKQLPSVMVGPLSLRLAAADGNASAQFEVAARYAEGRGVSQDFKEAMKWYHRSASSGFALSQYRLGTLYERGLGVDKDIQRARVWYERAAANGNIKAMHNLAVLAAGSAVGRPDYIKAARWFTVAAKHGLGDSQFNLAILYQHGLGVEQDDGQAYQWFSLAALSGDAEAGKRKSEVASLIGKAQAAEIDRRVAAWNRRSVDKVANDPHAAGQEWQRSG